MKSLGLRENKGEKHWFFFFFFWLYCRSGKSMKIRIMVGLIKICFNMDEEKSIEKQGENEGERQGKK